MASPLRIYHGVSYEFSLAAGNQPGVAGGASASKTISTAPAFNGQVFLATHIGLASSVGDFKLQIVGANAESIFDAAAHSATLLAALDRPGALPAYIPIKKGQSLGVTVVNLQAVVQDIFVTLHGFYTDDLERLYQDLMPRRGC